MTPTELKAAFPNASKSVILRNLGEGDKDALALAKEFAAAGTVAPAGMSPAGVTVPARRIRTATDAVEKEAALHNEIADYCRAQGWLALHGAIGKRTARSFGEPDFIIFADAGRVFAVECKTRTNKLTPAQLGVKTLLETLGHGHRYGLIRCMAEFIKLVTQ